MKKLLLALSLSMAVCGASAANYLHIKTDSGWEVLDLDQVDRLSFEDGIMKAQDASGATVGSYNQSALEEFYVDDTAGTGNFALDPVAKATFSFDNKNLAATMTADGSFEVYTMDGSLLVTIPAKAGDVIALQAMRGCGVVLVKSGNYVIKTAI